ncbi:MAG: efflux RND transporter periplasmic adaptor subunit [Myxococcales bacterium]
MRISSRALALALICGCGRNGGDKAEVHPLAVRVQAVARGSVADVIEVAGTLEPPPGLDVKLAPLVAGRLAEVLVVEGERVHAGQPLARLDPVPLRDAVTQAKAQLAQASAQQSNAVIKQDRAREAFSAGVAARQEVDDAQLQRESANAAVRVARAALSTAKNQLARSELRAPFDGVVVRLSAAPGEPVDPAKAVVEIARTEVLELRAPVAAGAAMRLRPGQEATVLTDGALGKPFAASVIAVAPVIDAASGTALVRLRVPNPAGVLRANAVGHARITADVHQGTLVVPRAAIVGAAEGPAVEVVQEGKAKRTAVRIGYQDGDAVELLSGVQEGQSVIVQGAYAVPDGTEVAAEQRTDAGPSETSPTPAGGRLQ